MDNFEETFPDERLYKYDCEKALRELTRNDISTLKAMKNAPPSVKTVVIAASIVLGVQPEKEPKGVLDYWGPAHHLLGKPGFLDKLHQHTAKNERLSEEQERLVKKFITDPAAAPSLVSACSKAAYTLLKWVRATYQRQTMKNIHVRKNPFNPVPSQTSQRRLLRTESEQKLQQLASPHSTLHKSATAPIVDESPSSESDDAAPAQGEEATGTASSSARRPQRPPTFDDPARRPRAEGEKRPAAAKPRLLSGARRSQLLRKQNSLKMLMQEIAASPAEAKEKAAAPAAPETTAEDAEAAPLQAGTGPRFFPAGSSGPQADEAAPPEPPSSEERPVSAAVLSLLTGTSRSLLQRQRGGAAEAKS
jgi:hypothetical protein